MNNPWEKINILDLENHLNHKSVKQSDILRHILKKQINYFNTNSITILGCAGGNNIETFQDISNKKIYGIDINKGFLDELENRTIGSGIDLKTIFTDLTSKNAIIPHTDMIIANLLIEYIGVDMFIYHINRNKPKYISITVQKNYKNGFISDSHYSEKFRQLSHIYYKINLENISKRLLSIGYKAIKNEEYFLTGNKRFLVSYYKLYKKISTINSGKDLLALWKESNVRELYTGRCLYKTDINNFSV